MKVRFLSSVPCALTLGGEYFGTTDSFDRATEINPKDNLFACFSPQSALPLGVFINERLFFSPPDGIEVYLLRDGAAIYAKDFPARSFDVKIVAQERFAGDLATVYEQGSAYLSLETAAGFFIAALNGHYESATIKKTDGLFFIEGENRLSVFNSHGEKLFDKEIARYRVENGTLKIYDPSYRAKSKATEEIGNEESDFEEYALTESGCYLVKKRATAISYGHAAHDFFESRRKGTDVSPFLTEELAEKADELSLFLGKYEKVFPCEDENECGVLRKRGERIYEADYYRITLNDGKISDVTKL